MSKEDDKPRFWFGVHADGGRTSVVLWDRLNQPEATALCHPVLLHALKADALDSAGNLDDQGTDKLRLG